MRQWLIWALTAALFAQEPPPAPVPWVCPMDPEVRSAAPASCPRCGMKLVAGIPEPIEYRVDLRMQPRDVKPDQPLTMRFLVRDPRKNAAVRQFEIIHEKLFHLFIVSEDLQYFAHEHPEKQADGSFVFQTKLPKPGQYRVLSDFYPAGGTPQLAVKTIIVPGRRSVTHIEPDLGPKQAHNMTVSLRTEPAQPLAGKKTMLFFDLDPADGLEPYLGANGHMLAASADLIDMIHGHPAFPEPGRTIQFNVIFPRAGIHRVWVQFQRNGVVNTAAFNVPVKNLE